MDHLWLLVQTLTLVSTVTAQTIGCDSQMIISNDETITPPDRVRATSHLGPGLRNPFVTPPEYVLNFGRAEDSTNVYTWCTASDDSSPSVKINFTEPVVITSFISSGTIHSDDIFYVTNFTLEYTDISSGEDQIYVHYSQEGGEIKYFSQTGLVQLFTLEQAVKTDSIRLSPLGWHDSLTTDPESNDGICQGVGVLGCRASGERSITASAEPTTIAEISATSFTSAATTKTESVPITEGVFKPVVIRDYQVLKIALPIALITILVVIAIACTVVGILLVCLKRGKQSPRYDIPLDSSVAPPSPVTAVLDNSALYNMPNELLYQNATGNSGTIRTVKNDLYGQDSRTDSTQVESDNLEIIYSDGQYEYISGDPQLSGNSSDQESMEDNLVYVFSESGQEVETSPTKKEDFRVNRNDSYQPVNEEFHALNLYN